MTQRKKYIDEEEHEFSGHESFPAINAAETVDCLIDERGIQAAAQHAAIIARVARAMGKTGIASDWDNVYRKIIERRGA